MLRVPIGAMALAAALCAFLPACSSRQGGPEAAAPRAPRSDPYRLTRADIEQAMETNVTNLYDLVQSRRPTWMRVTVGGSAGTARPRSPVVWLDNVRYGDLTSMRQIPLTHVQSVRYLRPSEAQMQLGLDNLGGAIVVETMRRN